MKSLLWIPIALLTLGGCSLISPSGFSVLDEAREKGVEIEEKALDAAALTVDKYCVTPQVIRIWFAQQINSRTSQAKINITCMGDLE